MYGDVYDNIGQNYQKKASTDEEMSFPYRIFGFWILDIIHGL